MDRFSKGLLFVGALLVLTSGCGSDPGGGTKTLYVIANMESDGSAGGTSIDVLVQQGGSGGPMVTDATVEVVGDKGGRPALTYCCIALFGKYTASNFAWEPGWRLRITRGADKLEAYIVVPGLTTITSPTGGQIFDRAAGAPLVVRWKDDLGRSAQQVTVDTDHGSYKDQVRAEDPGYREIPATYWTQSYAQERIRVIRENLLNLEGGVLGSEFKARTRTSVDFAVQ